MDAGLREECAPPSQLRLVAADGFFVESRRLQIPDVYFPGTIGTAYTFLAIEILLCAAWLAGLARFL